ncbi:hypothetical protein ABFA07_008522 [Porites harrisoni]
MSASREFLQQEVTQKRLANNLYKETHKGSMSGESEVQNIFPAAFALMEHTPESSNLQDARGLGGFRTCFTCRK